MTAASIRNIALFCLFMLASAIAGQTTTVPGCRLNDQAAESVIAEKVRQLDGVEYCQFRKYNTLDDVDGDDAEDFLMLFTVEDKTGNNSVQFLAFFGTDKSQTPRPIVVKVGERGDQIVTGLRVEKKREVILEVLEYQDKDPMCCPSKKGQVQYLLKNGNLVQGSERASH